MKKKKTFILLLIFSIILIFSSLIISATDDSTAETDETKIYYSSYLNIAKNETYSFNLTIKSLKNIEIGEKYLSPINAEKETVAKIKLGDYGFYVNGQFNLDEPVQLNENGKYHVQVVNFYYDDKETVYMPNNSSKLEDFYIVINKNNNDIVPGRTTFLWEKYSLAPDSLFENIVENLSLNKREQEKYKETISQWYENFSTLYTNIDDISEQTIEKETGQKIVIKLVHSENSSIQPVIKNPTPIVVDTYYNDVTQDLLSDVINVYQGLEYYLLINEANPIIKDGASFTGDFKITKVGTISTIYYRFKFYNGKTITMERKVYIIRSSGNDTVKPTITFNNLKVNSLSDIKNHLYDGIHFFDSIKVTDNSIVENLYTLSDETIYGIATDVDDVLSEPVNTSYVYVNYTITDKTGNSVIKKRKFIIIDNNPPIILEKYNVIKIKENDVTNFNIDDYMVIIDDYSTTTRIIEISRERNVITYKITATDQKGNVTIKSIYVYVIEKQNFYKENIVPFLWKLKCFFTGTEVK